MFKKMNKLKGFATGIGSLPYKERNFACQKIFQYFLHVPHWPQLPKLNFRENMYVQYSENFPGIIINENKEKIYLEGNKFQQELETFYQNYLNRNLDYFAISEKYASGFYAFCSLLKKENLNSLIAVKGQITGPLTFGLAVKDQNGRSIFYNEQIRDALVKFLQMKALWQITRFTVNRSPFTVILFIDEPYLTAYGSAYTAVSREEIVQSLNEVISGIRNYSPAHPLTNLPAHRNFSEGGSSVLVGIHCCANTDWSIVLETDIDILSFDAYNFFDSFLLYREEIKKFIERDGILAWGIVPTDEKVFEETNETLKNKFLDFINQLVKTGISEKKLFADFLITPSCGLGTKSEEITEQVLLFTSELSKNLSRILQ